MTKIINELFTKYLKYWRFLEFIYLCVLFAINECNNSNVSKICLLNMNNIGSDFPSVTFVKKLFDIQRAMIILCIKGYHA